jgi:hypothetical protein
MCGRLPAPHSKTDTQRIVTEEGEGRGPTSPWLSGSFALPCWKHVRDRKASFETQVRSDRTFTRAATKGVVPFQESSDVNSLKIAPLGLLFRSKAPILDFAIGEKLTQGRADAKTDRGKE